MMAILMLYYTLVGFLERITRKYHEFVARYCSRVHSTSQLYPRQ